MIFINNKYTRCYYSIISNAQSRVLPEEIYAERHHIIPKSLGGSNLKDNLVKLTAREHFICHLLLTKMTKGESKIKMAKAAFMFATSSGNQNRYIINSHWYESLRLGSSNARKGQPAHNKGIAPSRVSCLCCKEEVDIRNFSRYHKECKNTTI